jgi:hypothetical protein
MNNKIMIATPMYGGQCYGIYAKSLLEAAPFLEKNGYIVDFVDLYNESLITKARNTLAHMFLKSDNDYLLFIDADQSFRGEDILRMLKHDKDIIAAPVPKKIINWENVVKAASRGSTNYETYSGNFNINMNPASSSSSSGIRYKEPLEVNSVGTGMMLIKRNVFDVLTQLGLEKFKTDSVLPFIQSGELITDFFHTTTIDQTFRSEDMNFCKLWTESGGKIYVDLLAKVKHMGSYAFSGTIIDHTKIENM